MASKQHRNRIVVELQRAGLNWLSIVRSEGRHLPNIIHEDEHIGGAIYGFGSSGGCMIIATEKRVIYLDKKPFFTTKDILTYDIVSGVQLNTVGPFASVTLQTRGLEYSLKYVGHKAAEKFADYIEARRLSGGQYDQQSGRFYHEFEDEAYLRDVPNQAAYDYIAQHDVAILSSTDSEGQPNGAVVHYYLGEDGQLYFLAKSASKKSRNIMQNSRVSLTIYETGSLKTAQIEARSKVETDPSVQEKVFQFVVKEKDYREGRKSPPITTLKDGHYIVFRLTPTSIVYSDYSKK